MEPLFLFALTLLSAGASYHEDRTHRGSAPKAPLSALLLMVTYQVANASNMDADIGTDQVAVASNSVRPH